METSIIFFVSVLLFELKAFEGLFYIHLLLDVKADELIPN